MARDRDDERNGRGEHRQDSDYEVGRSRTPKHTRWQKGGASPNPKGRPKGSRNFKTDLVEELSGKIAIHEGGKKKILRKQQAMIKRAVSQAIQGDTKAMNSVISMMMKLMGDEVKTDPRPELNDNQKRVLENYTARLKATLLREIAEGQERRREPEMEGDGDADV